MTGVVIVSAVRTALGRLGGSLKDVQADDMAAPVIKAALGRAGVRPDEVGEVILGQTKQSADAANLARVAALKAGCPVEIPAFTVHRQCGSGLQAVYSAMLSVAAGETDVVVAGGVESMSTAPYYLRGARYGLVSGNAVLADPNTESQPGSQPREVYGDLNMGLTAENIAERYGIGRAAQDEFALESQRRAWQAIESGRFRDEILPLEVPVKKAPPLVFDTDEYPRRTSLELLAALPPAFKEGGSVTAGNSSGRNDGAACLVLMSADEAAKRGADPLATVRSVGVAAVDPRYMGVGPVPATRRALAKAGLELDDIGLIELNEAFAAQSLAVIQELGLDPAIVNVNGGAIALGHPIGCSGARILTTLLHEMRKRRTRYGLATICIAGGQGMAAIVEATTTGTNQPA